MHFTARLPILIGAGLLSAAIGAAPAQAAGASHQGPQPPHGQGDLIGYFENRSDCDWAARLGEMQNRWDRSNCDDVNHGPFRGMYELTADVNNAHDNGYPGDHHPGGGHGPHH
ncbi:hypothetical protein ACIA5C_22535 [Actinoplanes sp. NPDC051343]|jgi:hypothetical protein|uniref:hypothetical protein n=1 Tax=Actinoplanes sp. NPDC051343 TaxID=3363906 RepID=UPI00379856C5